MSNVEPRVAALIANAISLIPDLESRYQDSISSSAQQGSRRALLMADELGERAYHIAAMHISSSLDHARTMARLWETSTVPAYSLFTLARTAHESALMAEWLMEAGLSLDNQIARGVGAQYDDYCERGKLETELKSRATGQAKLAAERRAQYMLTAEQRGFAHTNDKGELVPNRTILAVTDLFNRYETSREADGRRVPGAAYYRFYSAFSHGKQWSQLLGDLVLAKPMDDRGNRVFSFSASDDALAHSFTRPIKAIERALGAFCGHGET